jgi:hypothetical protein
VTKGEKNSEKIVKYGITVKIDVIRGQLLVEERMI